MAQGFAELILNRRAFACLLLFVGTHSGCSTLGKKADEIVIRNASYERVASSDPESKPNPWKFSRFFQFRRTRKAPTTPGSTSLEAPAHPSSSERLPIDILREQQPTSDAKTSSIDSEPKIQNDENESLAYDLSVDDSMDIRLPRMDSMAYTERQSLIEKLSSDQWKFYSRDTLVPMGIAFGIGATVANTQIDEQIQKDFRSSVLNASSHEWFEKLHASKELGNGYYTLPLFGAAWLANEYVDGPPAFEAAGTWGERSMRGFMVGAPAVVAGQYLTGGSRPSEPNGSGWHPLEDNNGVSGHAFMSSLPFITAAKMTKNPWAKTAWYAGSTLGPLSRMNDNAHYPSQVGLGWCLAYLAATSIDPNTQSMNGWRLKPLATPTGSGMAAEFQW